MLRGLVLLTAAVLLAPVASGDDLYPPPWERNMPDTTYAHWDTWFSFEPGVYLGDSAYPFDREPEVHDPFGFGEVLETYDGRPDVLHLTDGDWLELHVPNVPEPRPLKDIYLQIVWHWDGAIDIPDVYVPSTGSTVELIDEFWLDGTGNPGGWWYSRFHITIQPNPDFEEIDIWPADVFGDLYIDQIVIDTICIPEPATLSLLVLGAMAVVRRRR